MYADVDDRAETVRSAPAHVPALAAIAAGVAPATGIPAEVHAPRNVTRFPAVSEEYVAPDAPALAKFAPRSVASKVAAAETAPASGSGLPAQQKTAHKRRSVAWAF